MYQRAAAYITDPSGRVLVFDAGQSDAPTQVPGGGVSAGEDPETAVVREVAEEAGLERARIIRKLGEAWRCLPAGLVPPQFEEQVEHAFHLVTDERSDCDEWQWIDSGPTSGRSLSLRWVTLEQAEAVLWRPHAMWLGSLHSSVERLGAKRGR